MDSIITAKHVPDYQINEAMMAEEEVIALLKNTALARGRWEVGGIVGTDAEGEYVCSLCWH